MKILILEGIATSGKTTVKNKLMNFFKKNLVVEEDKTLMPILNNTNLNVSIGHLKKILKKALSFKKKDVLIFDRLYFTHIFRTGSSLKDFREIESLLLCNEVFLAFLKINKTKISKRIFNAMKNERANTGWVEYVKSKGNKKQIISYYQSQQALLLDLLNKSRIDYKIYNTSKLDSDSITRKILKEVGFTN